MKTIANKIRTAGATVSGALFAAVILVCGGAAAYYLGGGAYDAPPGGSGVTGAGDLLLDLDLNSYDIYNQEAKTTDAAADSSTGKFGQDSFWNATGDSVVGGSATIAGGIGSRKVRCTSFGATADGDTLAIAVVKDGVVTTTTLTAKNGGAGASQWNCETSTASCCTALYNYLVANPVTGIASVSNSVASYVGFIPSPDTTNITLTITEAGGGGAPVFGTATNSENGVLNNDWGLTAGTKLKLTSTGYGLGLFSGNVALCADSLCAKYAQMNNNGLFYFSGGIGAVSGIVNAAASGYSWSGRTITTSPADGKLLLTNAAGTSGTLLDFTNTDDSALLLQRNGTSPGVFYGGGFRASNSGDRTSTRTTVHSTGYYSASNLGLYWSDSTTNIVGAATITAISSPAAAKVLVSGATTTTAGLIYSYPQVLTCATSGDANHSTCGGATVITSNILQTICNDADGCIFTISESGMSAVTPQTLVIHGPAANHLDVDTSAGVIQLNAAAGAMVMDQYDTLTLAYDGQSTAWVEQARSAN